MSKFTITQESSTAKLYLYPNSDYPSSCTTQLTPSGCSDNWDCVNDIKDNEDDDSTFVYTTSISEHIDMYELTSTSEATSGTIKNIRITARAKSHTYSPSSDAVFKILWSDSGCTYYKSSNKNLTTNYQNYSSLLTTNPNTGSAWTWNDLHDMQIGIECSSPTVKSKPNSMTVYCNANLNYAGGNNFDKLVSLEAWAWSFTRAECPCIVPTLDDDGSVADKTVVYTIPSSTWTAPPGGEIQSITWMVNWWSGCQCPTNDPVNDPMDCNRKVCESGDCNYCTSEHPLAQLGIENDVMVWSWWTDGVSGRPNVTDLYYCPCRETQLQYITMTRAQLIAQQGSCDWSDIEDYKWCARALQFDDANWFGMSHGVVNSPKPRVVINYLSDVNPEIRTTQMYATVSYLPDDSTCSLNKPTEISTSHQRNTTMLNFWDGSREVYDTGRSGHTTVFTGGEFYSGACETILCVRDMARLRNPITITGLTPRFFNKTYRIRQFGWKLVSQKPEHYTWILECEEVEE